MTNIIYPEPGKEDQVIEAMKGLVKKGLMREDEYILCLKLGGMPQKILTKIKIRMNLITVQFISN